MATKPSPFKAYDIRGQVPTELNREIAYRIGRAIAVFVQPKRVVVGRDMRLSSESLAMALNEGLVDSGVDVFDIGLCGTEQVYFATFSEEMDGGVMVTASHNPENYNGMKLVRAAAQPISTDSGLREIEALVNTNRFPQVSAQGQLTTLNVAPGYIEHLLSYIDNGTLKPLRIVANPGNGTAGRIIELLEPRLPFELIKVHFEPDGTFPNGVPNPLLPQNRATTRDAVRSSGADFGIAWDGDFDRCFFFDHRGNFIEGYYIVGLLAAAMLEKHPGQKIVHDPRLTWNTLDVVGRLGGISIQSKAGHAFIKERMREEDAVYGGEMSAHYYFRDFAYCDSGMIPWLLLAERICKTGRRLADLVKEAMAAYPCSGEINFRVADPQAAIDKVLAAYAFEQPLLDRTDGVSAEFDTWRFNLRSSNTEPLLRLNVETRGDYQDLLNKTERISSLLQRSV
jgi:phosphomannomutase